MKILYLDCFCGFDVFMFLGSLLDMGAYETLAEHAVKKICGNAILKKSEVKRCAIEAIKADITIDEGSEIIPYEDMCNFVDNTISDGFCKTLLTKACNVYLESAGKSRIAKKGETKEYFVSVLCASYAVLSVLNTLGVEYVICSSLKEGCGTDCSKNPPNIIPAPQVLEILQKFKIPFYGCDIENEMIDAWSAAFLSVIANEYGPVPQMDIIKIGYGAGEKDLKIPNLIRTVLGEQKNSGFEHMFEIGETNLEFDYALGL